jgi:hypothetical protein
MSSMLFGVGEVEEAGDVGVRDRAGRCRSRRSNWLLQVAVTWKLLADEAEGVGRAAAGAAAAAAAAAGCRSCRTRRRRRGDVVAREAGAAAVVVDAVVHEGVAQGLVGFSRAFSLEWPSPRVCPELVPDELLGGSSCGLDGTVWKTQAMPSLRTMSAPWMRMKVSPLKRPVTYRGRTRGRRSPACRRSSS